MVNGEGAGKGDTYRKVDQKRWDENYYRIYKKKRKMRAEFIADKKMVITAVLAIAAFCCLVRMWK